MGKRSYDQYCAVARALDIVGERWTLLIVRELLTGPKRFKDLMDGLPGVGTNLLAARLKSLEGHGVVCRTTLPPPAGSNVYELTRLGRSLEQAVLALSRWGLRLLDEPGQDDELRPGWAAVAVRSSLRLGSAGAAREVFEFCIDGDTFCVRIGDGEAEARQGGAENPALALCGDAQTFLAVAAGRLGLEDAVESGEIEVRRGDRDALVRCGRMLGMATSYLKENGEHPEE